MNIFYRVDRPYKSNALRRIEQGLELSLPPGYNLTRNQQQADLIVAPVVSINDARDLPPNSVIWQLCYETAGGTPDEWAAVWSRVKAVFSYLKLPWVYTRMPLGYDPDLFNTVDRPGRPKYDILVTGFVDEDQRGEVIGRLKKHFRKMIHIGSDLKLGDGYTSVNSLTDKQMAETFKNSKYVASMRLVEGFELPIIEGAACGCQPIALDLECYRRWFDGLAFLVDPDNLDAELSVIASERLEIVNRNVERFTWQCVMRKFWNVIGEL